MARRLRSPRSTARQTSKFLPESDPGNVSVSKNQGLNQRDGARGDHYVRLKIVVPQDLSDSDRKHFEKLANTSKFKPRN